MQGDAELPAAFGAEIPAEVCVVSSRLSPVCWVAQGGRVQPLDTLAGQEVFAFAGIGRPGRFLRSLLEAGVEIVEWKAFSDHHVFSAVELERLRSWSAAGVLVTTEKDLARLPVDISALALRVESDLLAGESELWRTIDEALAG